MKDWLKIKRNLRDDENIALSEECNAIIQRKLPLKIRDPGCFVIPCSIGKINVGRALYDQGESINLLPLSMMKKLKCGDAKTIKMSMTLADRLITYPYGVLEDVLVKANDLLFLEDFIILDMDEVTEIRPIFRRPFLETSIALIYVDMGELILIFQGE